MNVFNVSAVHSVHSILLFTFVRTEILLLQATMSRLIPAKLLTALGSGFGVITSSALLSITSRNMDIYRNNCGVTNQTCRRLEGKVAVVTASTDGYEIRHCFDKK